MLVSIYSSQNNLRLDLVWPLERGKLVLVRCQGFCDDVLLRVNFSGYDCQMSIQLFCYVSQQT